MAAYRRVYESCHMQADCQEPGSAPEPYAVLPSPLTKEGEQKGQLVFPGREDLWSYSHKIESFSRRKCPRGH